MEFEGKITGVADIDKVFLRLPKSSQRRAYTFALRAGAVIVRDAAAANVRAVATQGYSTGTLEKNLRVYSGRKYRGAYRTLVQIRRGAVNSRKIVNGSPVRIGLYAAVLEYGKKGQPPRSWIRKAIREKKQQAVDKIRQEFNRRMVDVIKDAKR